MPEFSDGDKVLMKIIQWKLGQSLLKGTPFLEIGLIAEDGREASYTLYLTDRMAGIIRGVCRTLEIDPDLFDADRFDTNHPDAYNIIDKTVAATFASEIYKGKTRVKIAFINTPIETKPLEKGSLKKLNLAVREAKSKEDENTPNP